MIKFCSTFFLWVLAFSLAACSSDDNKAVDFNGEYTIEATATTQLDSNGGTCGDASGTMTVTDNVLDGSVLSTNGFSLDIDGMVANDGEVVGGFAQGSNTVATFTGSLSGNSGTGNWEDNFQCTGTWTAQRS